MTPEEQLELNQEYERGQLKRAQQCLSLAHPFPKKSRGPHVALLRLLKAVDDVLKSHEAHCNTDNAVYSTLTTVREVVVAELETLASPKPA